MRLVRMFGPCRTSGQSSFKLPAKLEVEMQQLNTGFILMHILMRLKKLEEKGEYFMGTTNDALAGLKAQMAQLQTDYTAEKAELSQILTDVAKLVAGATILPTGQVAVSAADIAALTASATALDQSLAADTAL